MVNRTQRNKSTYEIGQGTTIEMATTDIDQPRPQGLLVGTRLDRDRATA